MGLEKPSEEKLTQDVLSPGEIATSEQINLTKASHFTITVKGDLDSEADKGLTCYLRSSYDGEHWDTVDIGWDESGNFDIPKEFDPAEHAGTVVQKTVPIDEVFKYVRAHIENNATIAANNLSVVSTKQKVDPY